jgi:hypothetical protein
VKIWNLVASATLKEYKNAEEHGLARCVLERYKQQRKERARARAAFNCLRKGD